MTTARPTFACRFCGSTQNSLVADLGEQAPANAYIPAERVDEFEARYPLRAVVCHDCWLVALDYVVSPESIFGDYSYLSSLSTSWVAHANRFVDDATNRFGLCSTDLVLEIASNDGYLLKHVIARGIQALGIEPAANVAEMARGNGIPTETAFFDIETAHTLRERDVSAALIVANNVLAHVPSPGSIVEAMPLLLDAQGVVSVEVPHLQRLLDGTEFDTIYHEHYSYFSLSFLRRLFESHGLRIFDVEHLTTHGGSLRVFACHQEASHTTTIAVAETIEAELAEGLEKLSTYHRFSNQVLRVRRELLEFFASARRAGKSVVGYGAAAKGNTLINFCGIGPAELDYVVDLNPLKQKHFLPQSRIPVLAPETLSATQPDYVLILPWNLQEEITNSMAHIKDWGGRFVVAIPQLELL